MFGKPRQEGDLRQMRIAAGKTFVGIFQLHSVPEALVQQIVTQIENGDLKRGTCLPSQRELAKMFNVGLGTVREAVKILLVVGYVDVIRGKGTFVSENAGVA